MTPDLKTGLNVSSFREHRNHADLCALAAIEDTSMKSSAQNTQGASPAGVKRPQRVTGIHAHLPIKVVSTPGAI
jgi:hypothetical protein